MNYKTGDFLDKSKAYKCIVCDEKYAVFALVTTYEEQEALDCENVLIYSNVLKEKIPTPIEKILTLNKES